MNNNKVYKSMYESQRNIIKKMIMSIPRSELVNILQEKKIISMFKDGKFYQPLNNLNKMEDKE